MTAKESTHSKIRVMCFIGMRGEHSHSRQDTPGRLPDSRFALGAPRHSSVPLLEKICGIGQSVSGANQDTLLDRTSAAVSLMRGAKLTSGGAFDARHLEEERWTLSGRDRLCIGNKNGLCA